MFTAFYARDSIIFAVIRVIFRLCGIKGFVCLPQTAKRQRRKVDVPAWLVIVQYLGILGTLICHTSLPPLEEPSCKSSSSESSDWSSNPSSGSHCAIRGVSLSEKFDSSSSCICISFLNVALIAPHLVVMATTAWFDVILCRIDRLSRTSMASPSSTHCPPSVPCRAASRRMIYYEKIWFPCLY